MIKIIYNIFTFISECFFSSYYTDFYVSSRKIISLSTYIPNIAKSEARQLALLVTDGVL